MVLVLLAVLVLPAFSQSPHPLLITRDEFKSRVGDLPDLVQTREIRVLTTVSMTNYYIMNGQNIGFEYSILKEYERFLNKGRARRDKVTLVFIPVPYHKLIPDLLNGWGDIAAAGITITPERLKGIDFTDPYLSDVNEVLVANVSAPPVKDVWELAGRKIHVRKASSYYESLVRLNSRLAERNLRPVEVAEVSEFLSDEDVLEMVSSGIYTMTVVDSHLASLWTGILRNLRCDSHVKLREGAAIAWMVRKDNPHLKASLNQFLPRYRKGTASFNSLYHRYFEKTRWIKNPLGPDDLAKFSKYSPLFKKYGEMYNIDWILLAAQAFQESGLDHTQVSPAGAVGLMQILPSLGKDTRIGIRDVHPVENNVHAAVKYLALIRDNQFNDPKTSSYVRMCYALAAYNAGPARVGHAMNRAARMGFDTRQWFGHGEVAVLKAAGQEPVRYVSNITKYYLAYKLAAAVEEIKRKEKDITTSETSSGIGNN
jgi:membrane-bound lytic murein transglycosylase MltF